MKKAARVALILATTFVLISGYFFFNLKHLGRAIGYDEVYYFFWVDNWDNYQVYYPHHLLFAPASVVFQRAFTEISGITNTAFIQKLKNILFVSFCLGLFFLVFYSHSRRFWLSLIITVSIAISGSLWIDVHHHETSAIPALLINLNVLLLLCYRKFRYPFVFISLFSTLNAFAILLHQVYLLSVVPFFLILLFTRPCKDLRLSPLRNAFRSLYYLFLITAVVGGTYYYIGFVKLNLRLKDNPDGTQVYMAVPIKGNFLRYFYLIKAYDKWGKINSSSIEQAVKGYGSSFVTTFNTENVDMEDIFDDKESASDLVFLVLGTFLAGFIILLVPVVRRYGMLFPALLLWLVLGSLFIYWWEPLYIEHWIYITILTWILVFIVSNTAIERIRPKLPRAAVYLSICIFLLSFASVAYRENFNHSVLAQKKLFLPASARTPAWNEEYKMEAMYRQTPVVRKSDRTDKRQQE